MHVAVNLPGLGALPVLIGVVGEDAIGAELRETFATRGVSVKSLVGDRLRPTRVKTRLSEFARLRERATGPR